MANAIVLIVGPFDVLILDDVSYRRKKRTNIIKIESRRLKAEAREFNTVISHQADIEGRV